MNRRNFIKTGLIFVPTAAISQGLVVDVGYNNNGGGGGGACATSDSTLPKDEMIYGWEASETGLGAWGTPTNVTDNDAATFDTTYDTSALSTGKPTGACDRGLRATFTGTAGYDTQRFDRGSTIAAGTAVDVRWYVYVQTAFSTRANILLAGQNIDPTGGLSFLVECRDNAGTNEIRASGATDSAWVALTSNSWNLIHVHVDATNTSSTVAVNGGSAQTFSSSATQGVRYIYVGVSTGAASGISGQWVTDLLAVNTP